ncbi:MAG: glutathione synthase [Sandaracinaceae bacterium]|nr:glutathione synthase [Sandaracinaceae bacterium]
MRIVVVMDPPETVKVDEDTSFALMLAAQERGHRVDHCLISDLYVDAGRACARVRKATCQRDPARPIVLGPAEDLDLGDAGAVLMRKDPPFDEDYLWATLVLEHARELTLLVNDPRGLRDANEKIYATYFPELQTDTLVSNDKARIKAFLDRIDGKGVLKPLGGAGGEGVFAISKGDANLNAIIETLTRGGRRMAMAQRYLPDVVNGDKRIILLDGEPLGAILRVPQGGDLRSNIHVGGRVASAELDAADRHIIDTLAPRLRADGLYFVGLDVIGGKLTEVNVTSPTGIQQMSRFAGADLGARVIEWLEQRAS